MKQSLSLLNCIKRFISSQNRLDFAKPRPVRVALVGEVDRPGSYVLSNSLASQTVVDAIQKAGGLTFESDITNISLYRKLPGGKVNSRKRILIC